METNVRDLKDLRKQINNIDRNLVKLFETRMKIVENVADYKYENNLNIYDGDREEAVLKQNMSYVKSEKLKDKLERLFVEVMETSKVHQKEWIKEKYRNRNITIGFQGVPGSFSEKALNSHFGNQLKRLNVLTFEDLFRALDAGSVDYIVVPIENSSTGAIGEVYDLQKKYPCFIVGEEYIAIEHHLLGVKGSTIDDIEEVYSHPQGFGQCKDFLEQYTDWKTIPYYNTAKSAAYVSMQKNISYAAIGSREAGELYGLEVLKEGIHSNKLNTTRFAVFSKNCEINEDSNKISINFNIRHEPGQLFDVVKCLAERNINMLKIESRPIPENPWEYTFFLDLEGSIEEVRIKNALDLIKSNCEGYTLLGNYEKSRKIED